MKDFTIKVYLINFSIGSYSVLSILHARIMGFVAVLFFQTPAISFYLPSLLAMFRVYKIELDGKNSSKGLILIL